MQGLSQRFKTRQDAWRHNLTTSTRCISGQSTLNRVAGGAPKTLAQTPPRTKPCPATRPRANRSSEIANRHP
eukprot:6242877-Alexandrium_andersonii.AAC.1